MSAWGVLAFDNDTANDWAYGLDGVDDLGLVESAHSMKSRRSVAITSTRTSLATRWQRARCSPVLGPPVIPMPSRRRWMTGSRRIGWSISRSSWRELRPP